MASELGVKRCLICLDEDIDPEHSQLADRHDVVYELRYSQLVDILNGATHEENPVISDNESEMAEKKLTEAIEHRISLMNGKRSTLGKDELANWYQQYALLQGE